MKPLSLEEARDFLTAARDDSLGGLWTVALALGLRRGEVLGLHWEDVDLDAGRLCVRQSVQRQPKKGLVEVEPKSRTSRRSLPLPPFVVTALKDHSRRQKEQQMANRRQCAAQRISERYFWKEPSLFPAEAENLESMKRGLDILAQGSLEGSSEEQPAEADVAANDHLKRVSLLADAVSDHERETLVNKTVDDLLVSARASTLEATGKRDEAVSLLEDHFLR